MGVGAEREQHGDHVVLQVLQALRAGRRGLVCEGGPRLGLDAVTQPIERGFLPTGLIRKGLPRNGAH